MAKNYSRSLRKFHEPSIIANLNVVEPKVRYWLNLNAPHDGILCGLDETSDAIWWDWEHRSCNTVNGYNKAKTNNLVEVDRNLAEAIIRLIQDQ